MPRQPPNSTRRLRFATWALALLVGVVGGIYGIGGGSLLAPILIAFGSSVYEVAPATLTAARYLRTGLEPQPKQPATHATTA